MRCATCDRDQPPHKLGIYCDDPRPFCLQGPSGRGLECYHLRSIAVPVIPRPIAALPAQSGAFVEMAP